MEAGRTPPATPRGRHDRSSLAWRYPLLEEADEELLDEPPPVDDEAVDDDDAAADDDEAAADDAAAPLDALAAGVSVVGMRPLGETMVTLSGNT